MGKTTVAAHAATDASTVASTDRQNVTITTINDTPAEPAATAPQAEVTARPRLLDLLQAHIRTLEANGDHAAAGVLSNLVVRLSELKHQLLDASATLEAIGTEATDALIGLAGSL